MIKWIARWFNQSAATPAAISAASAPPALPADADAPVEAAAAADDTDVLFYRWLAGQSGGAGADDPLHDFSEKLILDELARLVESPQSGADLVPRVPAVIPQLLRSLRDDTTSSAELSRQLAQDVVLVAEAIREANSPAYRPAKPVRTIEAAIMLLGQNGMRMLLARVAFRPIMSNQSGRFAAQVAPLVWRQSELCAEAASMLAQAPHSARDLGQHSLLRANPFEAYLAGLLHHVGLIIALRLIDQIHTGEAMPASSQFCAALLPRARLLSARIAALWEFPVTVSVAIEQAGQTRAPPLAEVVALADRVATLRMLVDAGALTPGDPRVQGLGTAGATAFDKLRHEED
jgi:HD-like signal output (HDOD) protein